MHSLGVLLQLFWDICRFRRGPQHVPASDALMTLVLVNYALVGLLVLSFDYDAPQAMTATLADVMFMYLSTFAILTMFGHKDRLRQTLTAYAGCGALYNIAVIPILWWLGSARDANADLAVPAMLLQVLTIWALCVNARILQQAIETTLVNAFLLSLALVAINLQIVRLVLPSPVSDL
jgi:peptidoglycan biosynthesis protein MviN/MurJ (putative lipid II flippase)